MALKAGGVMSCDIQGWEYAWDTMNWDLLRIYICEVFSAACKSDSDLLLKQKGWWLKLALSRNALMVASVSMLTDGSIVIERYTKWPSGYLGTLTLGSKVRNMLADLVWAYYNGVDVAYTRTELQEGDLLEGSLAQGDDCAEQQIDVDSVKSGLEATALYEALGFKITDVEVSKADENMTFSYCSQRFSRHGAYPETFNKTLFHLLSQKALDVPMVMQFCDVVSTRPDFGSIRKELRELFIECGRDDLVVAVN